MDDVNQTPYDEVLYPGNPLPQTHPDRLATIATLYGMRPAPATRCRYLELGCGVGGNLAAMAYQHPDSEFVGIDLSARTIAIGQRNIADLGLNNVTLKHYSITDITPEFGTFDYITAHGVYSWVPEFVRAKMWGVYERNLAPQGVGYVSYNAYPGSHFRNAARDMMLYHVRAMPDPQMKIREGRKIVRLMTQLLPKEETYNKVLSEQLQRLETMPDEVMFHDDLEEGATPFLFHKFVESAKAHGLQYLSEANFAQSHLGVMPDYVTKFLQVFPVTAVEEREQYLDFFASRMFRQTLLCRADIELQREIGPDCVRRHYLAGFFAAQDGAIDPNADGQVKFKNARGVALASDHALTKAAVLELGARWPQSVPFDKLLTAAKARLGEAAGQSETDIARLLAALFRAYSTEQLEMHLYPPRLTTTVGERPQASVIARRLAATGAVITNLRHARVKIEDPVSRRFLTMVDGSRDRAALLADLNAAVVAMAPQQDGDNPARPEVTAENVERNLESLATLGLLVA
jgi:SAM-dependent methyltransferase